jgi:acrylyl-CoA reductase (NADPH)/3-hydroxypropionyl-CoA dehydratase/3-hydroxypropionyl-CoA synthetase
VISDEFFTGFFARCGQEIDVETDARRLCFKSMIPVEANFPLFIIYTSGTTGKPKGIVHAHGYLGGVMMTMQSSFDAVPGRDVALVLASFGWITGQSYMIAGCLANRVTTMITQANPVSPYVARFAAIIQRFNVSILKGGVAFLKYAMS